MFWKNRENKNAYSYVIAGLGNPGPKYENTRHNMGFKVLDRISELTDIKVEKLKHKALLGSGTIAGERVMLVKPQTFMNLSGQSLREILAYYKIPDEKLIVIYDDMDIPVGNFRIRKKGSAGTHNGMKSIVSELGTTEFPRIRVGIGSAGGSDTVDFVIGKVSKKEQENLAEVIDKSARSAICIVEKGIDKAMNEYNVRANKKGEKG